MSSSEISLHRRGPKSNPKSLRVPLLISIVCCDNRCRLSNKNHEFRRQMYCSAALGHRWPGKVMIALIGDLNFVPRPSLLSKWRGSRRNLLYKRGCQNAPRIVEYFLTRHTVKWRLRRLYVYWQSETFHYVLRGKTRQENFGVFCSLFQGM